MNKKISKENFNGICGYKLLKRFKKKKLGNLNQEVSNKLCNFIDKKVPFDENGIIEKVIDIDKFLDEFEKTL